MHERVVSVSYSTHISLGILPENVFVAAFPVRPSRPTNSRKNIKEDDDIIVVGKV
jgi:hypothetical protein